ELTVIPGTSLWLVETGNSRGDYYHETRELWDPAARAFVRVRDGKIERDSDASDDDVGESSGLRGSPTGVMSMRAVVFDGTPILYWPKDTGEPCGFAGGGWRVPGPRG